MTTHGDSRQAMAVAQTGCEYVHARRKPNEPNPPAPPSSHMPMTMIDDRRWGGRCRDEPQLCMQMSMRGAMYVTMTMLRPGLFLQREGPGSEPGNSLVRPDDRGLRVRS